jgi:chondroitin AC lyase
MLKGDEYHNIWPVYDWQKISGATIVQKPELYPPTEIQKDGLTDFVGAVTDGLFGAVVFDFKSPHDLVEAKKSWFFFDREYVCLGTDINSNRNLPVTTTINQVLMRSEVTVCQNGKIRILPEGNRELEKVKWVHQDGIGYIFPEPTTVNLSNQTQKGRWSDITDEKNISDKIVSEKVFMMWFDHGKQPENASYDYIVVPNVTVLELNKTSNSNHNIEILTNTSEIQAVKHSKLDICQIAFYKAGEIEISNNTKLKTDSPSMVMIKMKENKIEELSVSDPSRKLSEITMTVSGIYNSKGDGFFTTPNKSKNNTLVSIDLPQGVYAGKSVTVDLLESRNLADSRLQVGDLRCEYLKDPEGKWFEAISPDELQPADLHAAQLARRLRMKPKSPLAGPPSGSKWQVIPELTDEFESGKLDSKKWYDHNPT